MPPAPILLVTQNFPPDTGGIQNLMGSFAQALVAAGHRIEVFADRIRGDGPEVADGDFALHRFGGPRPLRRIVKRLAIARAMRRQPPLAILCDSWKSIETLPDSKAPVLALAHGMEFPAAPTARKASRIRAALARATAVAPNSRYTADRVRPFLAQPDACVPVGLPIPPQPMPGHADLARVQGAIEGTGPVLLTIGRLEPRKGVDAVLRSLPGLAARHPGLRYLIAGDGSDLPRLQTLAGELGVAERVQWLGRIDEAMKAALFHAADLFVMPTRREGNSVEGFGLVYLEAAWHGLPSLAGIEGGAADAIEDGVTGSLCDGADPAAVEAAIAALLAAPDRLKAMGAAAAVRVRSDFTWDRALPRYLHLMGL
ncbi:glycosyltransferase family 4 protein [Roseomonas stagni]|uniref:Glycosyltransferase family 4 protein n=1 Tax=Falsiroseomonas algicola TaxID=2716930 RepID=A0A6M1LRW2_9PROT|nr:glycosyltransferase family 4 protein [Falsiroseomonas algicola]NGM22957.1 glycosyltransferase family 4 protein [Falsiroseomonas algicola]